MMFQKMKVLLLILFAVATLPVAALAQTTNPDTILGKWTNEDGTRVIEFVKSDASYTAVIREAPDARLVGKKQLTNLFYRNGAYTGNVFLPKKGKSYPCTIKLTSDMTMELTAQAGLISKSQVWKRVGQQ